MGKYKTVFLAEKDSQVQALAKALGAKYNGRWKPAYNEEKGIAIVPLKGHVLVYPEPGEIDKKYSSFGEDGIFVFPEKIRLKPNPKEKHILDQAVKHLKEADEIIVATDFDAEGAAIAHNVLEYAGVMHKFKRMIPMGSEYVEELRRVIRDESESVPFYDLASAGKTRAFIDWTEGMSLSRALSYYLGGKYSTKLHFGGVKSPIIYIVVMRELERMGHKKTYFWTISGMAVTEEGDRIPFTVKYKNDDGKYEERFPSEDTAKKALEKLLDKDLEVETITRKKKKTVPPLLFELVSLQSEVGNPKKLSPKQVLDIAQKLYDHPISIQTYPRTDVPYLKEAEYETIPDKLSIVRETGIVDPEIIDEILSKEIPKRKTVFNTKAVVAHGAIVPTENVKMKEEYEKLNDLEKFTFETVVKRFVAAFMPDYEYEQVQGKTKDIEGVTIVFKENVPIFGGWKKIYEPDIDEKISQYKRVIPEYLSKGSILKIESHKITKGETKPKPFFTPRTLNEACANIAKLFPDDEDVKKYLSDHGIGTVATRSTILEQLMDPKFNKGEPYLVVKDGKVRPTEKAMKYASFLPPSLIHPKKRALLSKMLDMVKKGELREEDVIEKYREEIAKNIEVIKKIYEEKGPIAAKRKEPEKENLGTCPLCKKGFIYEGKKVFRCSEGKFVKDGDSFKVEGCPYMILKSSLKGLGKQNITANEVKKMLSSGKAVVTLKSKKTGSPYQASIKPNLNPPYYGVEVVFDQFEKRERNPKKG